ncbi:MAG: FdhF/YdeP family oxidoreductase [Moraxellaceae bacterium]|nr:FdhF/YdeP family oxidoreductase [Moraxellaceae bacterium]
MKKETHKAAATHEQGSAPDATGPVAGGWGALRAVGHTLAEHGAARGVLTLRNVNQPTGFDCPGCAWPDPAHASSFEFCENGVKAVMNEATSRRATPDVLAARTVSEWRQRDDIELEALGRLTEPMRYDATTDRYVAAGWDEAFADIATTLKGLASPDEALFYTSGRTSNEAAFLYQLFVRAFGTNNLPDCSNMCHEPSGVGLKATIGVGKGTVTLEDFDHADAIFIFGQNPGTNHPRMLGTLREASKRGAEIVVFNPLRERGLERFTDPKATGEMLSGGSTRIASHYFQPKIGGDIAVVLGIAHCVLKRARSEPGLIDGDFIRTHTTGFDAWRTHVESLDPAQLADEAGLEWTSIEAAADLYMKSGATILTWGMGITQHPRAVQTIQQFSALMCLRGNIGRAGAGLCPVRGHSNVQGDRTMGIYEKPAPAFLDRMEAATGIRMPRAHGHDTVDAIRAMEDGRAKFFFALGGNFAAATPDTERTWAALAACEMTVHVSTKPNRSHFVTGRKAWILPTLGRTERDEVDGVPQSVSVEDSMSMVHLSAGMNRPASPHLLSEPAIVARLAAATLPPGPVDWLALARDYRRIRALIEQAIDGFADFNARVEKPLGFHLRNAAREREWLTASGLAEFRIAPLTADTAYRRALSQDAQVFHLMTVRSHDQYNTTIYGLDDRYRDVRGERRVLFIHADDIAALGLRPDDRVDIESAYAEGPLRRAPGFRLQPHDIPRGCLAAYFPETNALVALDNVAVGAGTPASKSIPVRLVPAVRA